MGTTDMPSGQADAQAHDAETAEQAMATLTDLGYDAGDLEMLVDVRVRQEQSATSGLPPRAVASAVLMVALRRALAGDHTSVRLLIEDARSRSGTD